MFTIVFQPPMLPEGEYRYGCMNNEHLRRVVRALKTLDVEIIDVEEDGESMPAGRFGKLMTD